MKTWTLMALMLTGCFGSGDRGQSSKPDDGELSTFDQFTRWGLGIGGFTAPPSNGAGGSQDTASWGDEEDWSDHDADGSWDEGSESGEVGAGGSQDTASWGDDGDWDDGGDGTWGDDWGGEDGGADDGGDWDGGDDGGDWDGGEWGDGLKAKVSTPTILEPKTTKVAVTVGGAK